MRIQCFSLEGETPPRLELRWEGTTADIFLDGEQKASFTGASGLKSGWSTTLPDGSTLDVRAIRRALLPELSIFRNGRHILSSPSHPDRMLSTSVNSMIVLSGFLIVAGTLNLWGKNWMTAVVGAFYLTGALILRTRREVGAAIILIPLVFNVWLLIWSAIQGDLSGRWLLDVVLTVLFASFVWRSYLAAHDSRTLRIGKRRARPSMRHRRRQT